MQKRTNKIIIIIFIKIDKNQTLKMFSQNLAFKTVASVKICILYVNLVVQN